jgi:hypothetical protein
MECRACGAEIAEGQRFCRVCGTSVSAYPETVGAESAASPSATQSGLAAQFCIGCGAALKSCRPYCGACGAPVDLADAPIAGPMATDARSMKPEVCIEPGKCPTCGEEVSPTAKFCIACGASRDAADTERARGASSSALRVTELPIETPSRDSAAGQVPAQLPPTSNIASPSTSTAETHPLPNEEPWGLPGIAYETTRMQPAESKKRMPVGVWVAAAAVCLVLASFGVFMLVTSGHSQPSKTDAGPSASLEKPPNPPAPPTASVSGVTTSSTNLAEAPTAAGLVAVPAEIHAESSPRRRVLTQPAPRSSEVSRVSQPAQAFNSPGIMPQMPAADAGSARAPEGAQQDLPRVVQSPSPSVPVARPPYAANVPAGAQPAPAPAVQRIPRAGYIVWRGTLEKNGVIEFDGNGCTPGSIDSGLPGVPITVDLDTKNFAMVEYPSSSNGFRRMRIRSRNKVQTIILKWKLTD